MYQLYIDDGVLSRGHRKSMINPNFTKTGIAYCKHSTSTGMLVITYAGDFTSIGHRSEHDVLEEPEIDPAISVKPVSIDDPGTWELFDTPGIFIKVLDN